VELPGPKSRGAAERPWGRDLRPLARVPPSPGMPTKGERSNKVTDFSIAAIMAPKGPSFEHYHLQGLAAAAGNASANIALECSSRAAYVAISPTLDHRESRISAPSSPSRPPPPSSLLAPAPYLTISPWNADSRLRATFGFCLSLLSRLHSTGHRRGPFFLQICHARATTLQS
jgi:hypothetical protein